MILLNVGLGKELEFRSEERQNSPVDAGSGNPQVFQRFRYSDLGRQTYTGLALARSQRINSTKSLSAIVVHPAEGEPALAECERRLRCHIQAMAGPHCAEFRLASDTRSRRGAFFVFQTREADFLCPRSRARCNRVVNIVHPGIAFSDGMEWVVCPWR